LIFDDDELVAAFGEGGLVGGEDVRFTEFEVALDDLEDGFEGPEVEEIEEAIDDGEALFGHEAIDEGAGDHLRLGEFGDGGIAEVGEAEGVEHDDDALGVFCIESRLCEAEGGCSTGEYGVAAEMLIDLAVDFSGVGFGFAGNDFEEV